MTPPPPRLSILLLTEDSGRDGDAVLRALLGRLLRRVVDGADISPERWEPATAAARAAVQGNAWKSPRRRDLVALRQYIAGKLSEPGGFVFFHFDGDRPYAERATSENAAKFEAMIRAPVRTILEGPPPKRRERRTPAPPAVAPEAVERRLERLIAVVPFYSVEAWLYQNTERALEHCRANPRCRGGCAARLAAWAADRGALDEVRRPKEQLCFAAAHNRDLAESSPPIAAILAARTSLHDLFARLQACEALTERLAATRPAWYPPGA